MSGTLVPFYRSYDLPWEGDEQASRRFRRILRAGLILLLLLAVIIPLLPVPRQQEQEAVPERLARVMIEQRKQPPPPPPKAQEKPKPAARPVPVPQPPVNRTEQARRKAEKSGLLQFQDQLADLRRSVDLDEGRTRNLTGVVGADTHAERSLIASRVGAASGGVVTADTSRGFGSGAGSLSGHQAAAVTSAIARSGLASQAGVHPGGSGRASRSIEEMELVIDRNKGAIYNLYARALRDNPALQGKLVLQITIAPSGEVTEVKVLSSELHDPELEQKVVTRVKMLRFDAEDVAPLTATHTFDFFPA
ncbi:MAG TPA: AgmX/PglI C-terminal domain-containing protein [Steroidobacteraceae bacterium]|nr:AgmX/PglI C-terminal domain-containing protein [Steroidobacteraceae bacterium]